MASSDTRGVRHVKCPRCRSVLQEPGVPVYQCGGCGATLRAKDRSGESPSRSGLPPPQTSHLGSGGVASSSRSSTPSHDARTSSGQQATGTTGRCESGDLVSARKPGSGHVASTSSTPDATRSRGQQVTSTTSPRQSGDLASARNPGSGDVASTSSAPDPKCSRRQVSDTATQRESRDQVPLVERKEHDPSTTNRGVHHNSEPHRQRGTGDAERSAGSPGISVSLPRGSRDATSELQADTEKRRGSQVESDAGRKKHSGEAAVQPPVRVREEPAPKSPEPQPSRERDAAAVAGGKAASPPRQELPAEDLAPLRHKILKTVDELKGDLSELFRKSPDLNPTTRARPPRLPDKQARSRHAAAVVNRNHHGGSAARAVKVAAAPPLRGLPSRRYRRCRADPCCDTVQPSSCHGHHGCCGHHHGKPECSSCRGHCGRPTARAQEPSSAPAREANKRRPPPRHHCRPVLKGAPFIICSSCFALVQVPADFAVSATTTRLRRLRCGSCAAVLSYSYRDPARKKAAQELDSAADRLSADGSDEVHCGYGDPFAPFVDAFGLSSYSTTEDEQPLHVSRNTSFDTVDGAKAVGRLHRLMGYGSASELLLRHSPDLYESFDGRTATPDSGHYDRKGKGVCVDAGEDDDIDDSDDEDGGVLKRSAARGAVWPLPGMPGKGVPGQGAIRIKS